MASVTLKAPEKRAVADLAADCGADLVVLDVEAWRQLSAIPQPPAGHKRRRRRTPAALIAA